MGGLSAGYRVAIRLVDAVASAIMIITICRRLEAELPCDERRRGPGGEGEQSAGGGRDTSVGIILSRLFLKCFARYGLCQILDTRNPTPVLLHLRRRISHCMPYAWGTENPAVWET